MGGESSRNGLVEEHLQSLATYCIVPGPGRRIELPPSSSRVKLQESELRLEAQAKNENAGMLLDIPEGALDMESATIAASGFRPLLRWLVGSSPALLRHAVEPRAKTSHATNQPIVHYHGADVVQSS